MEYSILTKDGQLRPPQPEETDESPMDAEEENLLLDSLTLNLPARRQQEFLENSTITIENENGTNLTIRPIKAKHHAEPPKPPP